MGGGLDPDAGDGEERPSALPIITENDAIRPVIGMAWRQSNWQAKAETWTRFGAAMGDAPLMVVDDPYREQVTLKPIHPDTLAWYDRDDYGNCRGYTLVEARPHPDAALNLGFPTLATYTEECIRVGQSVQFTTYLNNEPYDWRYYPEGTPEAQRVGPTWVEPYGFVPLVLAQHRDLGLGWGMAEMHPTLPKIHELDDLASKLDDAVRKTVDPRWFISGVQEDESLDFTADEDEDVDEDGTAARRSIDALFARDPGAKAMALVAQLNIADTSARIAAILAGIERDHPELVSDLAGINASGKARRVAQERVEALVIMRRVNYDNALACAHKMLISIGAMKRYPGYEGFDEGSYERGELDHSIGNRPVFTVDVMDEIEESKARADTFKVLVDGGMPMPDAAEEAGFSPDRVKKLVKAQADAEAQARELAKQTVVAMPGSANADQGSAPNEAAA